MLNSEVYMINKKYLILILLYTMFFLIACNNETVIPETTLDVYAHVANGDDVSYTKLEEGVIYEYNANDLHLGAGFIDYWQDVHPSLTIISNGNVMLSTADNGVSFQVGEVQNNLLISVEQAYDTYSFVGSSTVGFVCKKLDTDTISWTHQVPPPGTVRELTISAWYEKNRDMTGDPQVKITMRITVEKGIECFTLEILSIERTPPAYW